MRKAIAILLLFVGAGVCTGQEVKLPSTLKTLPGAWVVVAPSSLDGGPPRWEWDAGLTEVDLSALFGPEIAAKARGKVFTSNRPGTYEVRAWNAKGDAASPISRCTLTVIGSPAKPMPDPPKDPAPSAKLYFLVVRPDSAVHPDLAKILSLPGWSQLSATGHLWKDKTLSEARTLGVDVPAGTQIPCVVILEPGETSSRQIAIVKLPATNEEVLALPKAVSP